MTTAVAIYDTVENPSEAEVTVTVRGILDDDLLAVRHIVSMARNSNNEWRVLRYRRANCAERICIRPARSGPALRATDICIAVALLSHASSPAWFAIMNLVGLNAAFLFAGERVEKLHGRRTVVTARFDHDLLLFVDESGLLDVRR